ncbi:MAG: hypothetical protein NTY37_10470 [Methanothrix sp.]|nr:hypothetical protein [Methanothrix sp.]
MASSDNDRDIQKLVQSNIQLIQSVVDKYDEFDRQIKSWAITLWVATIASGLVQKVQHDTMYALIGVSVMVLIVMGIYDNIYKIYRKDYKKIREDIASMLRTGPVSISLIYFPDHPEGKCLVWKAATSLISSQKPHINLMYWFLIFVSFIIAMFLKLGWIPNHSC